MAGKAWIRKQELAEPISIHELEVNMKAGSRARLLSQSTFIVLIKLSLVPVCFDKHHDQKHPGEEEGLI